MTRGWHVWVTRSAAVPCILLTLLAACTPTARVPSGAAGSAHLDSATGPFESGRSYAFGQMLAREQERNAALQQQLEERGRQVEQLQAEVQQLHQQEGELRAALEQGAAGGAVVAAAPPAPQPAPAEAATDKAPPPEAAAGSAPPPERERQDAAAGSARPEQEAASPTQEPGEPVVVASLRAALVEEQGRRQAVEHELERLKEETSTPPYAEPGDPTAELAATRAEVGDLREALAAERVERERMADDLRLLEQRAAHVPPVEADPQAETAPEDAELRSRIEALNAEKDAIVESFNRNLAASQQHTNELEEQLAASQAALAVAAAPGGTTAPDRDAGSMDAENAALRARLDEEHRRTEELAAKLRVATRVTDLIFKMQAQQAQDQPVRSP
jgi:hypothetical protein